MRLDWEEDDEDEDDEDEDDEDDEEDGNDEKWWEMEEKSRCLKYSERREKKIIEGHKKKGKESK